MTGEAVESSSSLVAAEADVHRVPVSRGGDPTALLAATSDERAHIGYGCAPSGENERAVRG
ncbi:hypothetical protein [Micromonospora sp. U21]|uniref:hypothetical protein n=1 Tax=Micromonospora sp. U21 TaxID=2824899 RepID=UPI001B3635B1|nr:hypothetical protein [Micromonospora sp. U21]MBQ0906979.1 hypothetical protein [Micromonospora sp. U21]